MLWDILLLLCFAVMLFINIFCCYALLLRFWVCFVVMLCVMLWDILLLLRFAVMLLDMFLLVYFMKTW
jgi:hypothetical protein